MERILVPIDESDPSTDALHFAIEKHPDAAITALHVVDPGDFWSSQGIEDGITGKQARESYEKYAEKLLEETREEAADRGADIETDYVVGRVARSVVDYLDEHEFDHVVIGSHGRTGASRVLLGSVAEAVTRRSPVPVTVVR